MSIFSRRVWHVVRHPDDVILKEGDEVTAICGKTYNYKVHDPKGVCKACFKLLIETTNKEIRELEVAVSFMGARLNQIQKLATPPEGEMDGDS